MNSSFNSSIKYQLSKKALPLIFITQENDDYGFMFLIDTSSKENFIDSQYLEYYKQSDYSDMIEIFGGTIETLEKMNSKYINTYKYIGSKKVTLRTGEKGELQKYIIDFKFTGHLFTGEFYECNIADFYKPCDYRCKFIGVLGNRFLRKNKWIIDYDLKQIYSKQSIIK